MLPWKPTEISFSSNICIYFSFISIKAIFYVLDLVVVNNSTAFLRDRHQIFESSIMNLPSDGASAEVKDTSPAAPLTLCSCCSCWLGGSWRWRWRWPSRRRSPCLPRVWRWCKPTERERDGDQRLSAVRLHEICVLLMDTCSVSQPLHVWSLAVMLWFPSVWILLKIPQLSMPYAWTHS